MQTREFLSSCASWLAGEAETVRPRPSFERSRLDTPVPSVASLGRTREDLLRAEVQTCSLCSAREGEVALLNPFALRSFLVVCETCRTTEP